MGEFIAVSLKLVVEFLEGIELLLLVVCLLPIDVGPISVHTDLPIPLLFRYLLDILVFILQPFDQLPRLLKLELQFTNLLHEERFPVCSKCIGLVVLWRFGSIVLEEVIVDWADVLSEYLREVLLYFYALCNIETLGIIGSFHGSAVAGIGRLCNGGFVLILSGSELSLEAFDLFLEI